MTSGTDEVAVNNDLTVVEKVPPRLSVGNIGKLKTRKKDQKRSYLNALIYGESGVGKTLLSGMAALVPEMYPVLFVDLDNGAMALDNLGYEIVRDRMEIIPDEDTKLTWDDMQSIYDYLFEGKHPFKTVVIDSATEAHAINMGHLAGYDEQVEMNADLPKFEEWNETTAQMKRFFRGFRDLQMNTIFTARTYEIADPKSVTDKDRQRRGEEPKVLIRPSMVTKTLRSEMPAYFDATLYLYSLRRGTRNVRFVQTDKDDYVVARCRAPGVPLKIENPTMECLFEIMIRNPGKSTVDFVAGKRGGGEYTVSTAQQPHTMMRKKA